MSPPSSPPVAAPTRCNYVLSPPAPTTLPVLGTTDVFAVGRVFCMGRNYVWDPAEPAAEGAPSWFMKPATAVVHAQGALVYPPCTHDLCHEIELVVAIGCGGRDIDPAQAEAQHIWGYAAGLDLTRRDLQLEAKRVGGPWESSKSFDRSAPCTALVPASVAGHPGHGAVWLAVNGVERQRADLSALLWPVRDLVAIMSRSVTLMQGDLIFTGTPAGVGALQPGDVVTGGVAGIGEFSMTVERPRTPGGTTD